MARVINGTVKLAIVPSGDQSYMHTAHNLSIKTETLPRLLLGDGSTNRLTSFSFLFFLNDSKPALLFIMTCLSTENLTYLQHNQILIVTIRLCLSALCNRCRILKGNS